MVKLETVRENLTNVVTSCCKKKFVNDLLFEAATCTPTRLVLHPYKNSNITLSTSSSKKVRHDNTNKHLLDVQTLTRKSTSTIAVLDNKKNKNEHVSNSNLRINTKESVMFCTSDASENAEPAIVKQK